MFTPIPATRALMVIERQEETPALPQTVNAVSNVTLLPAPAMLYEPGTPFWTRDYDTVFMYLVDYLELVVTKCYYLWEKAA